MKKTKTVDPVSLGKQGTFTNMLDIKNAATVFKKKRNQAHQYVDIRAKSSENGHIKTAKEVGVRSSGFIGIVDKKERSTKESNTKSMKSGK